MHKGETMGKRFQMGVQEYERVVQPSQDGKKARTTYVYKGELYHPKMSKQASLKIKWLLFLLALCQCIVYMSVLAIPVPSNSARMVMLPAGLGIIGIGCTAYGVLNYIFAKHDIPNWEFRTIHISITCGTYMTIALLCIALIVDIWYQLTHQGSFDRLELVVGAGYMLCIVISLLINRRWDHIKMNVSKASEEVVQKRDETELIQREVENSYFGKGITDSRDD